MDWLKINLFKPAMRFSWPNLTQDQNSATSVNKKVVNAAFMRNLQPSAALGEIVGYEPLPRTEVVSRLWSYIKKHALQDSVNKRMINADSKLRQVFGKSQVSLFEMAGLIGKHLK
jgi:chromatin remodeling complex protein RSC6